MSLYCVAGLHVGYDVDDPPISDVGSVEENFAECSTIPGENQPVKECNMKEEDGLEYLAGIFIAPPKGLGEWQISVL